MQKYTKEQALQIIIECAKKYKENLLNRQLLFICSDKNNNISSLEVSFDASNFLHLTGVKVTDIAPLDFFTRCINSRLSIDDFEMADDSTTDLKLAVLPSLMTSNLSANSIGDYSGNRANLYTEKLAGSIKACMGFVTTNPSGRYVPNTVLNIDMRNYIKNPLRILAAYRKMKTDELYSELVYKAKKIALSEITFPDKFSYIQK